MMTTSSGGDISFLACVKSVLRGWTGLQLAVQHGFGGALSQEKALWMETALQQYFESNPNLQPYEVADLLEDIMENEFNTTIEDGSLQQISGLLCKYYQLVSTNQQQELAKLLGSAPIAAVTQSEIGNKSEDPETENSPFEEMDGVSLSETNTSSSMEPIIEDAPVSSSKTCNEVEMQNEEAVDDGWTPVRRKLRSSKN